MNKLLHAEYFRLQKSKSLLLSIISMILAAIIICCYQYYLKTSFSYAVTLDTTFYSSYFIASILLAIFASMHTGTEYHDGTIRNKLISGHSRSKIYFTVCFINFMIAMILNVVFHVTMLLVGIPLLGLFQANVWHIAFLLLTGIFAMGAAASCLTCLALLIHNRTYLALVSSIGTFVLLVLAGYLYYRIHAPEMIEAYAMTVNGLPQAVPPTPNPDYLSFFYRQIAQIAMDFMPLGQVVQLLLLDTDRKSVV